MNLAGWVARKLPWMFVLVAMVALVFQCHPAWRSLLLYDRPAIAEGQWWRLWSGHLVHFGWPHFIADVGLFLILGFILGKSQARLFPIVLCLIPAAICATLYLVSPSMARYGGLSAVDLALLLFIAGQGWQHNWKDWFWPAVLAVYVGEIIFESTVGQGHGGGLIRFDDPGVKVATSAHLAAAVCALLMLAGGLGKKPAVAGGG